MLSTSFDEKINPKTYEENPGKYIGLMGTFNAQK